MLMTRSVGDEGLVPDSLVYIQSQATATARVAKNVIELWAPVSEASAVPPEDRAERCKLPHKRLPRRRKPKRCEPVPAQRLQLVR
jgi:hypothetical protein